MQNSNRLYDFTPDSTDEWEVEDDVVMGGQSEGHFTVTDDGHGRFYGHVSLANDGGFSSIERVLEGDADVSGEKAFTVRLKGDGKSYTLRVQSKRDQEFMHEATFPTSGEWQTVTIPFGIMEAKHHGEPVDVPEFDGGPVHKLQFMIGNGKEQDFVVLLDWIGVASR
ncbi:CIA30 family protein [Neolewinella xylanilytica]|nr:CIA30 family protein [Neolewinella xylanilytica]